MNEQRILRFSVVLARVIQVFLLASGAGLLATLLIWYGYPQWLEAVYWDGDGLMWYLVSEGAAEHPGHSLSSLDAAGIWMVVIRSLVLLALSFGVVLYLKRILRSIRDMDTFHQQNAYFLRKVAHLLLGYAVIQAFSFTSTQDALSSISFDLKSGVLLAALAAYLLSVVFKEGHRLAENDKYTV